MIRKIRILILFGQVMFLTMAIILSKQITCPFKLLFSIPCPFCGLTRALLTLLSGNLKKAIYYNILFFSILLIIIFLDTILILEIVKNKNILTKSLKKFIYQHKLKIIIVCLILSIFSILINIKHGI